VQFFRQCEEYLNVLPVHARSFFSPGERLWEIPSLIVIQSAGQADA
jgi:hypothetical protein